MPSAYCFQFRVLSAAGRLCLIQPSRPSTDCEQSVIIAVHLCYLSGHEGSNWRCICLRAAEFGKVCSLERLSSTVL